MESISKEFAILGYSGHSYVILDAASLNNMRCVGYFEQSEKTENPFALNYLGSESQIDLLNMYITNGIPMISAIGNNAIRAKTIEWLISNNITLITISHPDAMISNHAKIDNGVFIAAGAILNPFCEIRKGVIINSGAIVEHDCKVADCAHIAPGAVLCGNVSIGKRTFVGAASVVKEGVKIGNDVIIGAGSVVLHDIPDEKTYFGNPAKERNGR